MNTISPLLHRVAAILFLAAVVLPALAAEPADRYTLMDRADKAIAAGKWAEAEEALQQALRQDPAEPTNVLLLSNLGMVQYYDGRPQEAIATLSEALRMAPRSVTVIMNRARILTSMGRETEAETDYTRALQLDTALAEPRFYRAMIRLQQGRADEARADADTLQARHPDHRLTHVALAAMAMAAEDYEGALPHLGAALKESPDATHYGWRALCLLRKGDIAGAASDIAEGLALDPTDGELYLCRAMLNKMRFRPDDAHADAEQAIKLGVDAARARALLQ